MRRRVRVPIVSRKQLAGFVALAAGTTMVAVGVSTQGWVTGTTCCDASQNSEVYRIGLLRGEIDTLSPFGTTTRSFVNEGRFLTAGETALSLCLVGLLASFVSSVASGLLTVGKMQRTASLGHSLAIWGAFIGGLTYIFASIAYSAVVPKLEPSLTFGWSFIFVLSSGFLVLIGGLIFVLSKQEQWPVPHAMMA